MTEHDARQTLRDERAARARAARAYANLRQQDIAEALGQSTITVKRMESAQKDISIDDLWTIADACNVPREFMTEGFKSTPDELRALRERVEVIAGRWTQAHDLAHATLAALGGNGEEAGASS